MAGTQGYANQAALVSTDWAAEHLNDPKVRLIEVDVDTTAYDQGHLPGAVGVNWSTQLTDQIRRDIDAWYAFYGVSIDGIFFDQVTAAVDETGNLAKPSPMFRS